MRGVSRRLKKQEVVQKKTRSLWMQATVQGVSGGGELSGASNAMRDHVTGRQDTSAGCVSRDVGDLASGVLMEWETAS